MKVKYTATEMKEKTSTSKVARMIDNALDRAIAENNNHVTVDIPHDIFFSEDQIEYSLTFVGFNVKFTKYSEFIALNISW